MAENPGIKTRVILVRFKSDENNILQLVIHLFSNQPIYYLLFDSLIIYIGMGEESNDLAISHGGLNQDNFESEFSIFVHPSL